MNKDNVEKVIMLLNETMDLLSKNSREDLLKDVLVAKERLTKRERVILVSGEFKRGKSSLVNALLKQESLCPVDIDIATSVVSLIRYGKEAKLIRHYGDVGGVETEEVPYEKLSALATGGAADSTWLLEIEIPCDTLKDGLVFIDTPGVGGLDPRHAFLTSFFLPKADVSLFVVDSGEPLSDTELSFLKDKVAGKARELIVVLNKADNAESIETSMSDVQRKVKDVLGKDVPVIPVSSKLKLEYLRTGEDIDFTESNFAVLEQQVAETIDKHSGVLCELAVSEASNAIQGALAPLAIQSEQFKEAGKEQLIKMQQRCLERKKEVESFCGPTSEWRIRLSTEIQDLKREVDSKLRDFSIDFSGDILSDILKEEGANANVSDVAIKLEQNIMTVSQEVDALILNKSRLVCEELGNEIFTNNTSLEDGSTPFSYEFDKDRPVDKAGILSSIIPLAQPGLIAFSVGSAVVSLTAIPLGVAAGAVILLGGVQRDKKMTADGQSQALAKALQGDIRKAIGSMSEHFNARIKQAGEVMQEAVQAEADRLQSRYSEVTGALEAIMKQTVEERNKHEKLVKTKIVPLEQMLKYYERFAKNMEGASS